MLNRLHEGHQGVSRSQARARLTLYWPGIDRDIENYIQGCHYCQDHLPFQGKEPLILKPLPERPFQQIAADIGYCRSHSPISAKQPWGRTAPANNNAATIQPIQPIHNIIDIQHIVSQQYNIVLLTGTCLHEH